MFRNALLAAILTTGFAGVAMAQEPITILGTGENFAVEYKNVNQNILGGGTVRVIGGGESAVYVHSVTSPAQRGRIVGSVTSGEAGRITYILVPAANSQPVG
jgi:hypothetical protein